MADLSTTIAMLGVLSTQHPLPALDPQQVHCLAETAFHEARGEGEHGQRMVIDVILNRVARPGYPATACGVIRQPGQFTYTRRPVSLHKPAQREAWRIAVRVASFRLAGFAPRLHSGTHFYRKNLRPTWAAKGRVVARVGGHIFVELMP